MFLSTSLKEKSLLFVSRLSRIVVQCDGICPLTEVKQQWAMLVLGWVTHVSDGFAVRTSRPKPLSALFFANSSASINSTDEQHTHDM